MEGAKKYLCADPVLEIPGLDQKFRLYREQFGRCTTQEGCRSTYEAVVTFRNFGGETEFVVNMDKTELWQQEESECNAVGQAVIEEEPEPPYYHRR